MRLSTKTLLATALLACCSQAFAATDTAQFQVQIVITESCDIQAVAASNIDFSTQARNTGAPVDAAGTLQVNCSSGTPYSIGLGAGLNSTAAAASANNRRMINGTNFVPYGLYRDAGRTLFWGNVIGTDTIAGTGNASNQSIQVFGRVPSTNVPAGTYVDTVIATVNY
jgi:spore coat protein U domain-containing protein, fimbrial subunit CupE1/2/3/6